MSQTIYTRDGPVLLPQDIWEAANTITEGICTAPVDDLPDEAVFDLFCTMVATALWVERMGLRETRQ